MYYKILKVLLIQHFAGQWWIIQQSRTDSKNQNSDAPNEFLSSIYKLTV